MRLSDLQPGQLFTMTYRSGLIEQDPLNTIYKFIKQGKQHGYFYFKRLSDPVSDGEYGLVVDVNVHLTADQIPEKQTPQP